jgi:hypothetical protein
MAVHHSVRHRSNFTDKVNIMCVTYYLSRRWFCVMQDGSLPEIVGEDGKYSVVRVRQPLADVIATNCDRIRDAVQGLIETYCHAFRVDFQLSSKAELPISKSCYMNLTCSAHSTCDYLLT